MTQVLAEALLEELKERVRCAIELLDEAFGPDGYDLQGVNQAHRVLSTGEAPRQTTLAEVDVDDEVEASRMGRPPLVTDEQLLAAVEVRPGAMAPSCKDVAASVGLSVLQATRRLERLEKRGLVSSLLWRNMRRGRPRRLWRRAR